MVNSIFSAFTSLRSKSREVLWWGESLVAEVILPPAGSLLFEKASHPEFLLVYGYCGKHHLENNITFVFIVIITMALFLFSYFASLNRAK